MFHNSEVVNSSGRHHNPKYVLCNTATATAAKSPQSCPTLCDPIDGSPPGSPVPGILQARTLEWVAIAFSNAGKWKVKVKSFSHVRLLATPWTAACQAPLSMGFSRQEYWSGVPLPSLVLCNNRALNNEANTMRTKGRNLQSYLRFWHPFWNIWLNDYTNISKDIEDLNYTIN